MRCARRDVCAKEVSERLIEKDQMRELVDLINEVPSLILNVETSFETNVMTSATTSD